MWHFERIIVGPSKGAHRHPFFLRDYKALCASMSRHVIPTLFSPFAQSFSEGTCQFSLQPKLVALGHIDKIRALPMNREDRKTDSALLANEKRTYTLPDKSDLTSSRATPGTNWKASETDTNVLLTSKKQKNDHANETDQVDSTRDTGPQGRSTTESTHTRRANDAENYSGLGEPHTYSLSELTISHGEDTSLLSACLDRITNPNKSMRSSFVVVPQADYDAEGLRDIAIDLHHFPLDAIAPGIEEPATPEYVEYLFAELSGESEIHIG